MKNSKRALYLGTGFLILLLAGMIYTWTLFSKSIAATFPDWSAQTLSLTFTIMMIFYAGGCFFSGRVLQRAGTRAILLAAAILFPAGLWTAAGAQTPLGIYLGFGVLSGFAAGLCYNSVLSAVSAWFPDRQGVASGIMLTGFGLSSFITGKLFAAFAPADGSRAWSSGFRLIGILLLIVLAAGSFILRLPAAQERSAASEAVTAAEQKGKAVHRPGSDIPTGEMLRQSSFWLYYIWTAFLTAAGLILVSQASGIAGQVGNSLTGSQIATAVGMISILNAAGRVCIGIFFDRNGYRRTMWLVMGAFLISACSMIAAIWTGAFPLIILGFLAGGFAYGGIAAISPPLIADFYGRTYYASNFSLIATNALFTSFASVISGRMYDLTHSFLVPLLLMLGAVAVSVLLSFMIRRPGEEVKRISEHTESLYV